LRSTQSTAPVFSATTYTATTCNSGADGADGLCTDMRGRITGTTTAATGTFVVTFDKAYVTAPVCVISPGSTATVTDSTSTQAKVSVTASTTAMTITYGAAAAGTAGVIWNYHCIE